MDFISSKEIQPLHNLDLPLQRLLIIRYVVLVLLEVLVVEHVGLVVLLPYFLHVSLLSAHVPHIVKELAFQRLFGSHSEVGVELEEAL